MSNQLITEEIMKVNLAVALESLDSLRVIADQKYPGKPMLAWNLAKVLKKVEAASKQFNFVRDKLVRQYGTKTDDGKGIMVDQQAGSKFFEDVADLLKQDIVIKVGKFKIEEVNSGNVEPRHLALASWLFEEDEDEDIEWLQDRTADKITPASGDTEIVSDSDKKSEDTTVVSG